MQEEVLQEEEEEVLWAWASKVLVVSAMIANGVEGAVEEQKSRMRCRRCTTFFVVVALCLCYVTTRQEAMAALQISLLFASTSWLWVARLPLSLLLPYPLMVSATTLCYSRRARDLVFSRILVFDGAADPVVVSVSLSLCVATVFALKKWSALVARDHGVLQEVLGPVLITKPLIALFGFGNALVEEIEFRGLLLGTLLPPPKVIKIKQALLPVTLQAILFAAQHVRGGFPNGALGGLLVFLWGAALGFLRVYSQGLLAGYLVHVVADITIALLIANRHTNLLQEEQLSSASRQRRKTIVVPLFRTTSARTRRRHRSNNTDDDDDDDDTTNNNNTGGGNRHTRRGIKIGG